MYNQIMVIVMRGARPVKTFNSIEYDMCICFHRVGLFSSESGNGHKTGALGTSSSNNIASQFSRSSWEIFNVQQGSGSLGALTRAILGPVNLLHTDTQGGGVDQYLS